MLKLVFSWLDGHPWAYWAILAMPTVALLAAMGISFRRDDAPRKFGRNDWVFVGIVFAFLLAWRWPYFFDARALNQDESQFIAGAITLTRDPVFWRAVDGTTSGPLNFYFLLPWHYIGLPLDYFTARLAGLGLVWAALALTYRLFRTAAQPAPAMLSTLPPILLFGTTASYDFIHYSSEHVSLVLTALSAYWLLRPAPGNLADKRARWLGCLVAGLLPWAKIQTAPLAAALVGYQIWRIVSDSTRARPAKWRATGESALAAVLPSLLAFAVLAWTGQFGEFVQSYLVQNLLYANSGGSVKDMLAEISRLGPDTRAIPVFFGATLLSSLVAAGLYVKLRRRPGSLVRVGALLSVAACICIFTPRRAFPHYLILAIGPFTLLSGGAICELWPTIRSRRWYASFLLAVGCLVPLGIRFLQPQPEIFGQFADNWRRPNSIAGTIVRAYARPGDTLGVWGWRSDLFVEAGLPQATRDPHNYWTIAPSAHRDFYRARYLEDFRRSRPAVFVDGVGSHAFWFQNREVEGHESFPALRDLIAHEYFLLVDLGIERIYVRSDAHRAEPRKLTDSELQAFYWKARKSEMSDAPEPVAMELTNPGGWDIGGRGVRIMLPPSQLAWRLDGSEREARFEYGYQPRAYTEGTSNGANVLVELDTPGYPVRTVFKRRLDPRRTPADRGTITSQITLPPFAPGSQLVFRTEDADASWDWVYFASLRYQRSPYYTAEQLPGFWQAPAQIEANFGAFGDVEHKRVLVLNTPSALTFFLVGTERHLTFGFGFQPGSRPKAGRTTDVVYQLQSYRIGDPPRLLFERRLQPQDGDAQSNRHHADVVFSDAKFGDRLVLRVLSDDPASGSGSYITDLVLE